MSSKLRGCRERWSVFSEASMRLPRGASERPGGGALGALRSGALAGRLALRRLDRLHAILDDGLLARLHGGPLAREGLAAAPSTP
eukprot:4790344-Pyramimonas_sp.AAC.1